MKCCVCGEEQAKSEMGCRKCWNEPKPPCCPFCKKKYKFYAFAYGYGHTAKCCDRTMIVWRTSNHFRSWRIYKDDKHIERQIEYVKRLANK